MPMTKPPDEPLDQCEQDGKSAKPGTQEKQHADIDWGPWRIEKRKDTLPGQELPHLNQVGERAGWVGAGLVQVGFETRVENTCAELLVDGDTDADQQSGPEPFGRPHDAKQEQADQRNGDQGEVASAEHDPVIDLQHVERGRQHQQVGDHAEQSDDEELAPECPEGARQVAALEKWRCVHGVALEG